jgi:hypothetical protein
MKLRFAKTSEWMRLRIGVSGLLAASLIVFGEPDSVAQTAPNTSPVYTSGVVEWQLLDGTVLSAKFSDPRLGTTGVALNVRATTMAHGTRFDVRLRNRSTTQYSHTSLRIRIPRIAQNPTAVIEGVRVTVPAEIRQFWQAPFGLEGAKYGFTYEISSRSATLQKVGPSTVEGDWGGRAAGIVRIDGKAYVVPEFWERQPRRISVTTKEIILTLYDGTLGYSSLQPEFDSTNEPLRAGEDAWDRFAVIDDPTLSDAAIIGEVEGLPHLTLAERLSLMRRFNIAPEGLRGLDADSEAWLRKYDQWQGVSWQDHYADINPARIDPLNGSSGKTTLFTLFEKGDTFSTNSPGTYSWRDYGDIQWGDGMSSGHYDWLRSAFKHYLRTGNKDALRWGMAAMRHAISVDFQWNDAFVPMDAGFARYEKGNHGLEDFPGRPSHTWAEGLFLAAALTRDPWVKQAAAKRANGTWHYFGGLSPFMWDGAYGEIRWITWPLLIQVRAFKETGAIKYWTKAKEIMSEVLRAEALSGGKGYIKNYAFFTLDVGTPGAVWTLQHGYSVPGLLLFAEVAKARAEWTQAEQDFLVRMARWSITAVPNGPYVPPVPPTDTAAFGSFLGDGWCPPESIPAGCGMAPDGSDSVASPIYNVLFADLFAWLAVSDPKTWSAPARRVFRDAMNVANHPDGIVGYLTDQFPGSESKVMGRIQLFGDRAAMWHAGVR